MDKCPRRDGGAVHLAITALAGEPQDAAIRMGTIFPARRFQSHSSEQLEPLK
jgi:hypothetical protein